MLQPESQNPREPWQSELMVHVLTVSNPNATVTLQSYTGIGSDAEQRYVRALAMRVDAFASWDFQATTTPIATTSAAVSVGPQVQPSGAGNKYVYMASTWSEEDCGNTMPALRELHFIVDGTDRITDHATANCAFQLTYGAFGLFASRPGLLQNGVSSANGQNTIMADSQIVLLGLP